jgi:phosphoglycolate phosphatase-like HAD superfamily hydrolase
VIIDREDVQNHKPHPEPLLKALASLSTRADEAVYVGDTQIDFLAARNAKTRSIILSASRNLGDYQITSLRELPSLLTKINEQ